MSPHLLVRHVRHAPDKIVHVLVLTGVLSVCQYRSSCCSVGPRMLFVGRSSSSAEQEARAGPRVRNLGGGAAAGSDDHAAAGGAAVPASRPTSQSWTGKIEVIDLCSGFGYLGMFLSEMLPPSKVSKITLVDKCWSVIPQPPSSPSPTHTLFPQPLCFCLNSPILLRSSALRLVRW